LATADSIKDPDAAETGADRELVINPTTAVQGRIHDEA